MWSRLHRIRFAPWWLAILAVVLLTACEAVPDAEERARRDRADDAEQFARLARVTAEGGDLNAAANLYRRAVAAAPDDAGHRIALGQTLIRLGAPHEAAGAYQGALKIAPDNVEALTGLGVALDLQGDHRTAQARYREGLELAPGNAPGRRVLKNNLALSLALNGEFDAAIALLREVVGGAQATPRNRLNLALVMGLAGRTDEAVETSEGLLSQAEISNNLAYYERLREMAPGARRRAVIGLPPAR